MIELMARSVETLRIDCECYLEKEFTKLICILYLIISQVDSCQHCVYCPLT